MRSLYVVAEFESPDTWEASATALLAALQSLLQTAALPATAAVSTQASPVTVREAQMHPTAYVWGTCHLLEFGGGCVTCAHSPVEVVAHVRDLVPVGTHRRAMVARGNPRGGRGVGAAASALGGRNCLRT